MHNDVLIPYPYLSRNARGSQPITDVCINFLITTPPHSLHFPFICFLKDALSRISRTVCTAIWMQTVITAITSATFWIDIVNENMCHLATFCEPVPIGAKHHTPWKNTTKVRSLLAPSTCKTTGTFPWNKDIDLRNLVGIGLKVQPWDSLQTDRRSQRSHFLNKVELRNDQGALFVTFRKRFIWYDFAVKFAAKNHWNLFSGNENRAKSKWNTNAHFRSLVHRGNLIFILPASYVNSKTTHSL